MEYRSTYSDWRSPRGLRSTDRDWGVPTGIEERRWGLRSAYSSGGAPLGEGVWSSPTMCNLNLMCAMASAVMQSITVEGQNLPQYSSWENISVTFFPVAYSDNTQWIAAATSANVCGVRGWKNCDVVGCRPELLAVKKNWLQLKSMLGVLSYQR